MSTRQYSLFDRLLVQGEQAMRTLVPGAAQAARPSPAQHLRSDAVAEDQRRHVAGLMRINHTGEVCAQALYQGQALTARSDEVRELMQQSAAEENDHLIWCRQRVEELGGRVSVLNPLFYLGSLAIGAAAGLAGDKWSLGFLAETERQVEDHLDGHLQRLPETDQKTRAIVEQMKVDERKHATTALHAGGAELPFPIRQAMRLASKVMTKSTYWI